MRSIARTLFLAAIVTLGISATGCEGADVAATSAPADDPSSTVTETSALCFTDNVSGGYDYLWQMAGRDSYYKAMGMRLYLTQPTQCGWRQSGTITGWIDWFDTGCRVYVQQGVWSGFNMSWQIYDSCGAQTWFKFDCTAVYANGNQWKCNQSQLVSTGWKADGIFTMFYNPNVAP